MFPELRKEIEAKKVEWGKDLIYPDKKVSREQRVSSGSFTGML